MDRKTLEAFLRLYEKKSLRAAAEELYISPQGLSRTIQALEAELDVMLFRRTRQGMEPTAAGEYFYTRAAEMLRSWGRIEKDLHALDGRMEELSFVCSYGAMSALPYELFVRFQAENPGFSARWREFPDRQALQHLTGDEYELGLLAGGVLAGEDYETVKLFERQAVALIREGHSLYEKDRVEFSDLAGESIIMEGDDFWINGEFRRRCVERGFVPDIVIETGDISFCHKLCAAGQGVGISVDFVADFIRSDKLRSVPFAEPFPWPVYLAYRRTGVLSPGGQAFSAFLRRHFAVT